VLTRPERTTPPIRFLFPGSTPGQALALFTRLRRAPCLRLRPSTMLRINPPKADKPTWRGDLPDLSKVEGHPTSPVPCPAHTLQVSRLTSWATSAAPARLADNGAPLVLPVHQLEHSILEAKQLNPAASSRAQQFVDPGSGELHFLTSTARSPHRQDRGAAEERILQA
jgi:hypothetical protein